MVAALRMIAPSIASENPQKQVRWSETKHAFMEVSVMFPVMRAVLSQSMPAGPF